MLEGSRMDLIEWLRQRKQENEANLKFAETTPGFKLFQVTTYGGEVDITEQQKDRLRAAIADYQHAMDYLEFKATGLLPASKKPYDIK
jgi:hypothetical protein